MVTPEQMAEALARYEIERQELVKQLKEKDEDIQKLRKQLHDRSKLICDEVTARIKADPSIAEEYFQVVQIIKQVKKEMSDENTNL